MNYNKRPTEFRRDSCNTIWRLSGYNGACHHQIFLVYLMGFVHVPAIPCGGQGPCDYTIYGSKLSIAIITESLSATFSRPRWCLFIKFRELEQWMPQYTKYYIIYINIILYFCAISNWILLGGCWEFIPWPLYVLLYSLSLLL